MSAKTIMYYFLNQDFLEKSSILGSIEFLLRKYRKEIFDNTILDIGCGSKPYQYLFNDLNAHYIGIDFKGYSHNYSYNQTRPDYYFPKQYSEDYKLSQFKSDSYDLVVSFQVLEHHQNPVLFFSEINRILKIGGNLIITFPFIWELHEEPNDFQRLTHYQIKRYCLQNGLRVRETIKRGGYLSTISQLTNLALTNSKLPRLIKRFVFLLLLFPFQIFAYVLEKIYLSPDRKIFLGYTMLISKHK